ncbi:MAG: hypothetical protein COU29_04455 [Candidatus Magasanikbacteria bacterium CG10_big_fil_rev_8_21_14_0_10_36_32]|uniref:Uncharacterized protein n=1 Tax=Candidatus Magasanikbacteria bacterium CG10_big_fil_rev_8_21_14_0_10_36_32 TaxID=1974646 RepID=A0A2M6W5F8_9BACT|nr:MAG: hypothetical protein COU29_04455 [Candidatus Magasanikbacteria bacterium CG10_big_fil_rev_8_21_14_0_10_36_32]
MKIFKTKKFYIILVVILIVVAIGYNQYKKANQPIQYETAKVKLGDVIQTVEATGKVESSTELSLRFEISGTLDSVNVKEGDVIKSGKVLASLKAGELSAAVAQARANLNQKIAGATDAEIEYYRAVAQAAKADWDKTIVDTANSISVAERAVETAENNLKLVEGGNDNQIVSQAYESAVAVLHATLSKVDDGLTQADNILGVDNNFANDSFEQYLSITDINKLTTAKALYVEAKMARYNARTVIDMLTTVSAHEAIDNALPLAETALSKTNSVLSATVDALNATLPSGTFTQATLESKKTTVETSRAAVTAQYTAQIDQKQAIVNAKNSFTTYTIAYSKAVSDLNNVKATASGSIAIKESVYNQAAANLKNKENPSREVDLAPLRAALAQAEANWSKAFLYAPIDGMITKINKKRGEFVSATEVAVQMLSPHYEISVDIPETDVIKLKLNDAAVITLDAFGDETKFSGKIISIDPASTEIQDVVYYRVKVAIDDTDKQIKSGMTANITISTDKRENVLTIPFRATRTGEEGKIVRVLKNGEVQEVMIVLGLRGDDGRVEIVNGLDEGDEIIISTLQSN